MKVVIFALLGVTAFGIVTGKIHAARRFHSFATRKSLEGGGWSYDFTEVAQGDVTKSWSIKITIKGNNTILIDIEYDVTRNIIAFIHHGNNWVIIVDGSTGLMSWFTLNEGGVIMVNMKAGTGLLVTNAALSNLTSSESIDVPNVVKVLAEFINDHKSDNFNVNVSALVADFYNNPEADISSYFGGQYIVHLACFGKYVSEIRRAIKAGILVARYGTVGFMLPNFDKAIPIGLKVIELFTELYDKTPGTFDANFAYRIYQSVTIVKVTQRSG